MDLLPQIRYGDMSYIIYHQWNKQLMKSFPTVYQYLATKTTVVMIPSNPMIGPRNGSILSVNQQNGDYVIKNGMKYKRIVHQHPNAIGSNNNTSNSNSNSSNKSIKQPVNETNFDCHDFVDGAYRKLDNNDTQIDTILPGQEGSSIGGKSNNSTASKPNIIVEVYIPISEQPTKSYYDNNDTKDDKNGNVTVGAVNDMVIKRTENHSPYNNVPDIQQDEALYSVPTSVVIKENHIDMPSKSQKSIVPFGRQCSTPFVPIYVTSARLDNTVSHRIANFYQLNEPKQQQQQLQQSQYSAHCLDLMNGNRVESNGNFKFSMSPEQSPNQIGTTPPIIAVTQNGSPNNNLSLNYVTERILASVLPARTKPLLSNGTAVPVPVPDVYEKELIAMLEQKHGKNYKLFDLESCITTITLEKLCELCKHIDLWLRCGREKVVVLQDRHTNYRLGVALAAYLEYLQICSSNTVKRYEPSDAKDHSKAITTSQTMLDKNYLDLDIFSMRKFLDNGIGPLKHPSHRRYLKYFSGLLSGRIKINSASIYMDYISLDCPMIWLHFESLLTAQNAVWKSFVKIYEGPHCVFTSDIYIIPITTRQFIYEIGQLKLRGDITIRFYQISQPDGLQNVPEKRKLMFSTQFHTCAINDDEIIFRKNDLDLACDDPQFPMEHTVTLHFINKRDRHKTSTSTALQSPLVKKIKPGEFVYESLEDFSNDDESKHLQGPLDGSLYATILKSPKSPRSPIDGLSHRKRFIDPDIVITPPTEFSNNNNNNNNLNSTDHQLEQLENSLAHRRTSDTSTTISTSTNRSQTPTIREDISPPERHSSKEYLVRHQSTPGGRNQSQQRSQSETVRYANTSIRNPSPSPLTYQTVDWVGDGRTPSAASYYEQKNLLRNPLILSLDSGISSRRVEGSRSSQSSSSFPSPLVSEDRDRELDDILNDMLLNVQNIPDIGTGSRRGSTTTTISEATSHNSKLPNRPLYTTTTQLSDHNYPVQLSRSQSSNYNASLSSRDDDQRSIIARRGGIQQQITITKERSAGDGIDYYDTSSTTTTLTPPPSESGRDTPLYSDDRTVKQYHQYHQTIRESNSHQLDHNQHNKNSIDRELITMNRGGGGGINGVRSSDRQQQNHAAVTNGTRTGRYLNSSPCSPIPFDKENEDIPYHAREDSLPFTYGYPSDINQQTGTGMIKSQSGLSSPSLVRKTLAATSPRPTSPYQSKPIPIRHDFEDMLKQRREDVLNEKYSRSDRIGPHESRAGNYSTTTTTRKWTNGDSLYTNGHPDPMKRSASSMDGMFARSNSFDGTSGHTWLQLQQQKLRAKKQQEQHRYTGGPTATTLERNVPIEFRDRPLRSRSSYRNDGYASDTAAFGMDDSSYDEVDYRRPLHVRTTSPPSAATRYYHTMTQETTTKRGNERPFVAVKRAYDQQKVSNNAQSPSAQLTALNAAPLGHIVKPISVPNSSTAKMNGIVQKEEIISRSTGSSVIKSHDTMTTGYQPNGYQANQDNNLKQSSPNNNHFNFSHNNDSNRLERMESFSSYRSGNDTTGFSTDASRPETPAFPITPRTPYYGRDSPLLPPRSPSAIRKDFYASPTYMHHINQSNESMYSTRRNSASSGPNVESQDVAPHLVKFVRDSSKYWYKPNITRDEAVALLRNAPPGTFLVRDSTTFAKAFGLVVKVATPPPGSQTGPQAKGVHPSDALVRHFLVEPTTRGVRLKGCSNEPIFTSLSALVYQHSVTPLALPCRLIIPDRDIQSDTVDMPGNRQVLTQGAACNVYYLFSCKTESLTGMEAVRKTITMLYNRKPLPPPTEVHFKVSTQGITLTDKSRQLFFRKHYPASTVSYFNLDPEDRKWSVRTTGAIPVTNKSLFAFVARDSPTSLDNQCHVFCELQENQPASAIVSFANKVIPGSGGSYQMNAAI